MSTKIAAEAAAATAPIRPEFEPLLSVPDLATALNTHPATIRRLIKDGELPALKVGPHWRVTPEALRDYIREAAAAYTLPRQQAEAEAAEGVA
jgi:excisionase family DNA binding protein